LASTFAGIFFSAGDDSLAMLKQKLAKQHRVVDALIKYQARIFSEEQTAPVAEEEASSLAERLTIEVRSAAQDDTQNAALFTNCCVLLV
jgi:hypothetical protein